MNDTWSGKVEDLDKRLTGRTITAISWYSDKTPIGVLEKNLELAIHRYYLWERMLKVNNAAAANPPRPGDFFGVERSPPWLAINSTENTLRWMLSPKQLKEREQHLRDKVELWINTANKLKALIKQQSNSPTPAAAAASEGYI